MIMLSPEMLAELEYFAAMILYGFFASLCYHILLLFRAFAAHREAVQDAEDILFFALAGFLFFYVVYLKNDGILRWYAYAGCGLGCFAYIKILSGILEIIRKWLLQKRRKIAKMRKKSKGQNVVFCEEKGHSKSRWHQKKRNGKGQVSVGEKSSPE